MLATLRHELRLQSRSLRFRFGVLPAVLVSLAAPLFILLAVDPVSPRVEGPGVYWGFLFEMLRFPSVALALIVAGNRSDVDAMEKMWPVLCSSPMANIGYLVRRAAAQTLIVLPITLIPVLGTFGIIRYADLQITDPARVLAMWSVQIAPISVVMIFFWTALVHITGTELGSLLLFFFGDGLLKWIFSLLEPVSRTRLMLHQDWAGFAEFRTNIFYMLRTFDSQRVLDYWAGRIWSSDVLPPLDLLVEEQAPILALFTGFALLLFGVSSFFLRRARSDLRPLVLSETHPLRNFMKYFHQVRQRYAPDGGLFKEPLVALAGLGFLFASVYYLHAKQSFVASLAERQYTSETSSADHQPVTPRTAVEDWVVSGRLNERSVDLEVSGRIRHDGEQPLSQLPFDLNPFLEASVEVTGRRATPHRSWARLFVDVEPALQPGDSVEIRFKIAGEPTEIFYHYGSWSTVDSFGTRYEAAREKVPVAENNDPTRTAFIPLILPERIMLTGADWIPSLRYGTWELTPKPVLPGEPGYEVPPPTAYPLVSVSLDLALPRDWIVGDSCGSAGRDGSLQSRCRVVLSALALRGGRRTVVEDDGRLLTASLPGHEDRLRLHGDTLRQVVELSDQAWPGLDPLESLVVIEGAPYDLVDTAAGALWHRTFSSHEALGRSLVLAEPWLAREQPLNTDRLISSVLARELLAKRPLEAGQEIIFEGTFGALMARRMGLGQRGARATITGRGFERASASWPLLEIEDISTALQKASALWAYVEALVGTGAMHAGIETFLSKDTAAPGTYLEMFQDIEAHSDVSLAEVYEDYVVGNKLPQLRLEDVRRFRTDDGRWRLEGTILNHGTGRLECPVIVESRQQQVDVRLKLEEERTPFEIVVDYRPETVQIDPKLTCFRWVTSGRLKAERVALQGE